MSRRLELCASDRVMVVAPHPDDETLGAGGLLQQARAAHAAVRVVFATDGENDPWAQRLTEWRFRLDRDARRRWGRRRRAEALAALACLGLSEESAVFLGLPDGGLTSLVTTGATASARALAAAIERFAPTLLVTSSPVDLHPDHSAAGVLATLAVARVARRSRMHHIEYLVHGPEGLAAGAERFWILLTPEQQLCKRRSVSRYRSQLFLGRRFFLSFVEEAEEFIQPSAACRDSAHAIERVSIDAETVRVRIRTHARPAAFGPRTLLVAGLDGAEQAAGLAIALISGRPAVREAASGRTIGEATFHRYDGLGDLSLPRSLLAGSTTLFLKVEHRLRFFDADGWTRAIDLRPVVEDSISEAPLPRVGVAR